MSLPVNFEKGAWVMNNLNSVLIEGTVVRDPELRKTPKGTSVCNFDIATNHFYKGESGFEKEVSFLTITTWEKLAEAVVERGKKGRGVRVVGRLKQDRWTAPDGKQKSKVSIVAEHVEFRPAFKKEEPSEGSDSELLPDENEPQSEEQIDQEERGEYDYTESNLMGG